MKKILICLTEIELKRLNESSKETGLSVSEIIRRLIDSSDINKILSPNDSQKDSK